MTYLSINKIDNVIEIAELVYGSTGSGIKKQPEIFIEQLSNYLEDFKIAERYSVNILHKYINKFSQEEKAELIALMWLGRGMSDGQLEDFQNLLKQVVELIPEKYATSYIIERPLLAKYLRDGLQKLNIWTSALS
ncbi:MAG: DUF3775 domain-containing protein [Nostoc sp. JL34]|uniref:DUF3775 domain-containing protein n=1 Tax=Nostoc sp. JL34 TaxID=2815397 RepID=UPI001E04DAF0|nr:DUF3775 domain-containing protein [Nostoc sp. JL34]MBN3882823.1 DUF3775 domain-containing protein [Nostoc sp. JL34]